MSSIFIYMTCASNDEARKIASALVEKRLVACANIFPPHHSIYQWKGKVESGEEVAVIMKTRAEMFENVKKAVLALHSYETPCLVALPIQAGHAPFLQWIEDETQATA
jgi:periplasmic divalent cation tolerance protein